MCKITRWFRIWDIDRYKFGEKNTYFAVFQSVKLANSEMVRRFFFPQSTTFPHRQNFHNSKNHETKSSIWNLICQGTLDLWMPCRFSVFAESIIKTFGSRATIENWFHKIHRPIYEKKNPLSTFCRFPVKWHSKSSKTAQLFRWILMCRYAEFWCFYFVTCYYEVENTNCWHKWL